MIEWIYVSLDVIIFWSNYGLGYKQTRIENTATMLDLIRLSGSDYFEIESKVSYVNFKNSGVVVFSFFEINNKDYNNSIALNIYFGNKLSVEVRTAKHTSATFPGNCCIDW